MEPESSTSTSNPELKRQSVEDSADAQPAEKKPRVENTASADGVPDTEAAALEGLSDADSGKGKKQQLSRRAAARVRMDDRKQGKRRAGTRTEREPTPDNGEPKEGRLPKRMCALLIGFCGSGYSGMQRQGRPEVKTIEDTLFNALVKAGAVSKDNSDSPSKVNFTRAARTDAGVHAVGNVVSMKMIVEIPGVPDIVARINEELPPEIRVWGYVRVQKSFNARGSCDSRKYTYFFPSYMLLPPKPGSALHKSALEQLGDAAPTHDFWKDVPADSTRADDLARKRQWRAPKEAVEALRAVVKKFEGTHNFHNFTVGQDYKDPSSKRLIKSIEISDPVVYGETEWISVLLHGQSFMLHQRKMIAAAILIVRTNTPARVMDELYSPRMAFIPKMPSLGLMLEYPIFQTYNKRKNAENEPVDFEKHHAEMEQFKEDFIYPKMRDVEDQIGIFDDWMYCIDQYAGNDLLWLNPQGELLDAATMTKGQRRDNPFKEKKRFNNTVFGERISRIEVEEEDEEEEAERLPNKKEREELEG